MITKVISLDELKQMCNRYLELLEWEDDEERLRLARDVEVRYINEDGSFGYTSIDDLFFYHDRLYYWTQQATSKDHLTLDVFEFQGVLQNLEMFDKVKVFPVIFAGVYTGYLDDDGKKIYTGDVVKVTTSSNANSLSIGGRTRATSKTINIGLTTVVGIDCFPNHPDDYYYILDNCPVPMQRTHEVKVLGNVFYDLDRSSMIVNIYERCCTLAIACGTDMYKLHLKMARAPYFVN